MLYNRLVWWYLAAPVMIFLLRWVAPWIGFPLFCGLVFAVDYASMQSESPDDPAKKFPWHLLWLTLGVAFVVCHGAYAVNYFDWWKHRGVYLDLARCEWPIQYDFNGYVFLFSYYFMYYLLAGTIAPFFDPQIWQHVAEATGLLGYGLVIWGYFSRSRTLPEWVALLALFIAYGAWDAVGVLVRDGQMLPWITHFVNWNGTEATSNVAMFYWVPQHVVPAWLGARMMFNRGLTLEQRLRFSPLLAALVGYWSPLVACGLVPFMIADWVSGNTFRALWRNKKICLFSVALMVPFAVYIARDSSAMMYGWAWNNRDYFVQYYGYFLLFNMVPMVGLMVLMGGWGISQRFLLVAIGLALVSPLYHFGIYNDLTMRLPMVSYYFMLVATGDGAIALLRDKAALQRKCRLWLAAGALCISSIGPLYDAIPANRAVMVGALSMPLDVALQRVIRPGDLRSQYVSEITPAKEAVLRPLKTCPFM